MGLIHSDSDLPDYPFKEPERRYLRIVNATTPRSDIIRAQAALPQRPPRRHYLSRLPVSTAPFMRRQASNFILLPENVDHFTATTDPPREKIKTHTKIYRGLARFASKSSTNLAELSSATKEKVKDFKLTRSKSSYHLPGLVSSPSSPSRSLTPPLPSLPTDLLQGTDRSSVPVIHSESVSSTSSVEPLPAKSLSKWDKTRRSLRAFTSCHRSFDSDWVFSPLHARCLVHVKVCQQLQDGFHRRFTFFQVCAQLQAHDRGQTHVAHLPHSGTPIITAPSSFCEPFQKPKHIVFPNSNIDAGSPFRFAASTSVHTAPSPAVTEATSPEARPSSPEAEPSIPRPARFKTRFKPYTPRPIPADPTKVTFPNGLDGDNPYPRPYGGGWRNHPYHLYERLPTSKLLVDPYAKPAKEPFFRRWFCGTKKSSRNYYGGRSAAQREPTRYVYKASNGDLHEAYEMDDLSPPKPESPEPLPDAPPKPFVGTAVSILQRVRKNVKVKYVKAHDPAGNVYFYEKSYVPRFTKHSLRPSKRTISIRNFLNRRLYGRPGDGANLLMPHIPFPPEVIIPGVDDTKERAELEARMRECAELAAKKPVHPFGPRDWLDFDDEDMIKKKRAADKAQKKKRALELKRAEKKKNESRGLLYSLQQRRLAAKLKRAKTNIDKEKEEEEEKLARRERMKASETCSSPDNLSQEQDLVERCEAAQGAQEEQRAIGLEEARKGKKKVSVPDQVDFSEPDFAERRESAQEAKERQWLIDLEKARKGKKKVTVSDDPASSPNPKPGNLRRAHSDAGVDAIKQQRKADKLSRANNLDNGKQNLEKQKKERLRPSNSGKQEKRNRKAEKRQQKGEKRKRKPDATVRLVTETKPVKFVLPVVQASVAGKQQQKQENRQQKGEMSERQKEVLKRMEQQRIRNPEAALAQAIKDAKHRKSLAEASRALVVEKPLSAVTERNLKPVAEESLNITPPRLRTPNRYKDASFEFEEAEQLVTPKSPEQCQFEADQAATPRTPIPYVLPTVEEESDVEDGKQIADLTNTYTEFL
ncbi:unnamed protein product [Aureobasidium vineae]|uniref:Uncharacterized protein n=1 Tax=Aureobasidium vineae TaxID=2773715 RepID=A0A9N8PC45_9PEZI|nr:unnamed protein product [Aureobasidium vineae]